ncbi:MAG: molybdopterin molybdotransferase MoeA [Holophaga sp.]|nr:molybdopterin molybdotransferase MoeA [Holophaga sp.]
MIDLSEALTLLETSVPTPCGGAIYADRDDPALDRSAMDGIVLRAEEGLLPRRVMGIIYAGDDPSAFHVEPGTCLRIMTGACLPPGGDAVVPVENLQERDGLLVPIKEPHAGDHIRRQGDQARLGALLVPEGRPFSAARCGLLAQVGSPQPILNRTRVGIASTGDELRGNPSPWQIRDSNGPMLVALAHALGADTTALPSVPDDPDSVARFFGDHPECRVMVTAGGVSMGEKDHLPAVLKAMGAQILFHKIRLKPGKPTLAAILGNRVILCLPGNPVSAYLNALLFLPVILARLEGRAAPDPWRQGELVDSVPNPGDRPLLHPCTREGAQVKPLSSKGSADLVRLAQADVYAWIPEGGAEPGPVKFLEII